MELNFKIWHTNLINSANLTDKESSPTLLLDIASMLGE